MTDPLAWFGWGMLLFAGGLALTVSNLTISNDETWFWQVAQRVTRGDRLYRDVFYGATPLAVSLAVLLIRSFGSRLLVVKLINSACFTAIGLLVIRIGFLLGLPAGWFPLFVIGFLFVFCSPWTMGTGAPYTPLAYTFQLGALLMILQVLKYGDFPGIGSPWLYVFSAGAFAGLSFSTKQTAGLYTFAVVFGSLGLLGLVNWTVLPLSTTGLVLALVGFCAAVMLFTLFPVLSAGSWSKFLDYAFLNKRTYLRLAGISYTYLDGIQAFLRAFRTPFTRRSLLTGYAHIPYLVPPLVLIVLPVLILSLHHLYWSFLAVLTLFLIAAIADVFPRVSLHHLSCAVPVFLPILGLGIHQAALLLNLGAWVWVIAMACLLPGLFVVVYRRWRAVRLGVFAFSRAPGFQEVMMTRDASAYLEELKRQLDVVREGEPVLFLCASAGFLYRFCQLQNRTPFDYPLLTAFGLSGEQEVIDAICVGQIRYVCMDYPEADPLTPTRLKDFVLNNMEKRAQIMNFSVYYR